MCRPPRTALAALVLAVLAGGAAEAARAGTASGRPAQFRAHPGESNDLTVDAGSGATVQFTDAAELIVPGLPLCIPFPLGQAQCDPDGDPRDTDGGGVVVDLGDGDDRAIVRWIPGTGARPGRIGVTAGAGDDRLENLANGVIRFDGGDGDDVLVTGPTAGAVLLGGAGADAMTAGAGCCNAAASYADHDAAGVRVTLDGTANDGVAGEGDDVRTSGVIGSPGPDVITGDARANSLTGSGGADALDGGGGDDRIDATVRDAPAAGGPDAADTVMCGAGDDEVTADANDTTAVDCERVRVGGFGGPALVLESGARRAGRRGSLRLTYRAASVNPANALTSRSTLRLLDPQGRAASSTARFVLGRDATVARLRVTLHRATRRRLARSRSGALALIA